MLHLFGLCFIRFRCFIGYRFFLFRKHNHKNDAGCEHKQRNKLGRGQYTDFSPVIVSEKFDDKTTYTVKQKVQGADFAGYPLLSSVVEQNARNYKHTRTGDKLGGYQFNAVGGIMGMGKGNADGRLRRSAVTAARQKQPIRPKP